MTKELDLMTRRIRRILLICSSYDSFSLDEDGRIERQIAQEYAELELINPPEIVRVETSADALELFRKGERFDLAISMFYVGEIDVFDFSARAKGYAPEMPVVLLSSFAREVYRKIESCDLSNIDYIFCWNNSPGLLTAIFKLLEDRMNAEKDILESGVQAILLVEDSVRYISTYLPALYKIVLRQNSQSIKDALNEKQQLMRKRARPKVLLATNYQEAVDLYFKYRDNLLGVISDIGFVLKAGDKSSDEKPDAGVDFCNLVRKDNPHMPFLMQSSQENMREVAHDLGVGFLNKSSKLLTQELEDYMEREFGFGDFVVTDHETGVEIARAKDLYEFENVLKVIPDASFKKLADNNYLSKWLYARGLFSLGKEINPIRSEDYHSLEEHRGNDIRIIHNYRIAQALGVVAAFNKDTFNDTIWFSKVGNGSLGGKARGLAFLNAILQKYEMYQKWEDVHVMIPRTMVITTEYFDTFIHENGLKYVVNSDLADSELLSEFVASNIPDDVVNALRAFIRVSKKPFAIRSSSNLEDSYHQPFAGVYSTYMVPRVENEDQQLRLLSKAIKSVYASVYFASAKSYVISSGNVISEEKMAIVIQEVCGKEEGGFFFPTLSGVARSLNFYPVGHEKPEEGIVKIAYGLGKAVVDGEQVLRFSPKYPKHALQTSTPELTMSETQTEMFALNLQPEKFKTSVNDSINLERLKISECTRFPSLADVASTWDLENMRIVDSAFPKGPKFVTFAQMLKYGTFPVAAIVDKLLDICKNEMKCDVEIEFAANIRKDNTSVFSVLQIRPISVDTRNADVNWDKIDCDEALLHSTCALGTGWVEDVSDIVYIKPEAWDKMQTVRIAQEISEINSQMRKEGRGYVLIGFGRWGTSQPSLGVPVVWGDISESKAIVECSLADYQVEPSQGTHFFQNLTSFNVGYINVNGYSRREDRLDFQVLDKLPAVSESAFLRHVRTEAPFRICIDGKSSKAVIIAG